jgi:hypothetical protein
MSGLLLWPPLARRPTCVSYIGRRSPPTRKRVCCRTPSIPRLYWRGAPHHRREGQGSCRWWRSWTPTGIRRRLAQRLCHRIHASCTWSVVFPSAVFHPSSRHLDPDLPASASRLSILLPVQRQPARPLCRLMPRRCPLPVLRRRTPLISLSMAAPPVHSQRLLLPHRSQLCRARGRPQPGLGVPDIPHLAPTYLLRRWWHSALEKGGTVTVWHVIYLCI